MGVAWMTLGPDSVEVSVQVKEKQGLQWDTANPGKAKPWGSGCTKYQAIGTATAAAAPWGTEAANTMHPLPRTTGAIEIGTVKVVFLDAAGPGDPLICAPNGQVAKAPADTAEALIIGKCKSPKGVQAGAVGLMRIAVV